MIFTDPNMPHDQRVKHIADHVVAMQELIASLGWKQIEAYLKDEENKAWVALEKAATGDMAMKASGAYIAIRNARKLPELSLNQAIVALKTLQQK